MKIKVVTTGIYSKCTISELNVTFKEYRQLSDLLHDYFIKGILECYKIDILKATDEELQKEREMPKAPADTQQAESEDKE